MKICVLGLGYVGAVTAACFADEGHEVVGVDPVALKVDQINSGCAPIVEAEIDELLKRNVAAGRLSATSDVPQALLHADTAIVCVGTPSNHSGELNMQYVEAVCREIGEAIRLRDKPLRVVLRSTMLPGSIREVVLPTLESASGQPAGESYQVLFHPEFLREGTSVRDFYDPPKIVVGECNAGDGARFLTDLYIDKFIAPRIICSIEEAEMVKYCDNLFHAVKVTFANEIGQYCYSHGVDSQRVMEIFVQDTKLNISPYYMKPGFAFGGSCLPKDLRAMLSSAVQRGVDMKMLNSVLPSNISQVERAAQMILRCDKQKIGFHGLAFKSGTDDLRESPYVELAERLLGKGCDLSFYDPNVHLARIIGQNKSFIDARLPHLASKVTDQMSELQGSELIVLCHAVDELTLEAWLDAGITVFDLTGKHSASRYADLQSVV